MRKERRERIARRPRWPVGAWSVVCLALLAAGAEAANRPIRTFRVRPIQVRAGNLRGVVKGYTGRPYASTKLALLDAKGKVVARTVTNAKGEYLLRNIRPGKYTALIGGKVRLPLVMTSEATVSRLIIVPRLAPAAAAGGAGAGTWAGLTTWTWVGIGGGTAAVAVAVPVVIYNTRSRGGSKSPISP